MSSAYRAFAAVAVFGLTVAAASAGSGARLERASVPAQPPSETGGVKTPSARDGVYSAAQAERGATIYKQRCGSCHVPEVFTGDTFMAAWKEQTAHALFDAIRATMPPENPGGLKRREYADIVAYLLKLNGLPPGRAELPETDDALKRIIIHVPGKKEP